MSREPKSQDALDQGRPRQKWSRAEKAAYAREKFVEELVQPPKNPIKPLVLPKKPPHRRHEADAPPTPAPTARAPMPPPDTTPLDPIFHPWRHILRPGEP